MDNMNKNSIENELLIVEVSSESQGGREGVNTSSIINIGNTQSSNAANILVSMKTYLHFSVFKRLLHADVLTRILQAFGVDVNGKNALITQQQYIAVNCFLRYGSMPKQMIIETWIKILDPYSLGRLP